MTLFTRQMCSGCHDILHECAAEIDLLLHREGIGWFTLDRQDAADSWAWAWADWFNVTTVPALGVGKDRLITDPVEIIARIKTAAARMREDWVRFALLSDSPSRRPTATGSSSVSAQIQA